MIGQNFKQRFYIGKPSGRLGLTKARISEYVTLPGGTTSTITLTGKKVVK